MISRIFPILYVFYNFLLISFAFEDNYKLPNSTTPKHYTLRILTTLDDEFQYSGKVEIAILCLNVTKKITLHRDWRLKLEKVEVKKIDAPLHFKSADDIPMEEVLYRRKGEFLTIYTKEDLEKDHHYLILFEFEGNISDTKYGFYRENVDIQDGSSTYAITNFEPLGARKVFPCYDEPSMKATFELVIGRQEKYNSTSNMPLLKTEPVEEKDGWYWDYFMNSDPISPHLVSFMIYDQEFVWLGNASDQLRILVRKKMRRQMDMVAKTGPKLLSFLQTYYQVAFPFPKLDFIVLPHNLGDKGLQSKLCDSKLVYLNLSPVQQFIYVSTTFRGTLVIFNGLKNKLQVCQRFASSILASSGRI